MENKKKKRYGIVAALLLLVLAAGVGTYAWLTATQSLENVFTVGSFGPTDKKPDPTDPEKPGSEENNGAYLFETKWVENSKIVPGATVAKNPNVGIKAGSDDAYVFIYVKNAIVKPGTSLEKTPYFTLKNTNWKPVEGQVKTNQSDNSGNQYVSGLFMYSKNSAAENLPAKLEANKAAQDVYTDELFTAVTIPSAMNNTDVVETTTDPKQAPTMTVSAYIFGAGQNGTEQGENADAQNALKQAKEWAKTQAQA
ncbi:SipW-dependent-type signal peptide-containing protein [Collinsella aerofaciens]|uniref:SipW-dependent-type signal peptide-containing protein n=1 Tax=Collinsella aerofaciens TaxID=74426 RepID=UPI00148510A3|nr:SipW-dependent-type signal peptide-containing protein [Collinsella aerofaciens]MDB1875647.1 SipW-dependent-type signal peptide-containing protein [Collinsella aerofaciens]MDB1877554.1 SipW-dependent-type signal peptide-containing protein [Collinsella aerofaciens]